MNTDSNTQGLNQPQTQQEPSFQVKNFNVSFVDQFARQIFMRYDSDLSGAIEGTQCAAMLGNFFSMLGIKSPTPGQSQAIMLQNGMD